MQPPSDPDHRPRLRQPQGPLEGAPATDKLKRFGPIGAALVLILGKLKWAIVALKFLKLHTLLSMLLMVAVYAQFWGWKFALGFVLLIFVHELGHALAMKWLGIPAGAPVFIPFMGAVIAMKGRPKDAWVEALVGIGGPALGTLGAAAVLGVGLITGEPFFFGLAASGFLINLFNMLPISPMDGGRITGVISRWIWIPGYLLGIGAFLLTWSPILGLILLLGLLQVWRAFKQPADYYQVPMVKRVTMAGAYFGLLAIMAVGMAFSEAGVGDLAAQSGATLVPAGLWALGKALFDRDEPTTA
ncbi:MAG: site-2 protease family protein [Myxococcota bacterium]|nr:site-2 protease family protein [Myxococcota bacterium]